MARRDSDLDSESLEESENEHEIGIIQSSTEKVSAPALTEGTVMETDSLNVPSKSGQELENSGGTITETVPSYLILSLKITVKPCRIQIGLWLCKKSSTNSKEAR
ncbi:hypothetical protein HAX54_003538, partial [Datura stramonium]|nr:hypothetical protein [Datura stramonium]